MYNEYVLKLQATDDTYFSRNKNVHLLLNTC